MKRKLLYSIVLIIFNIQLNFAVTKTWVGIGTGGVGTDFNTAANWSPSAIPTAADDVIIAFTNGGTINLSASATINSLTITLTGNNNVSKLNIGVFGLTINAASSVEINSGNANTQLSIVLTTGVIDFVGNVVLGSIAQGDAVFISGNVNSTIICRSNYTQGTKFAIPTGSEPGTLLFDGTGTQNFTSNDNLFICNYRNIVVGSINNPTLNLIVGLDPQNDDILGDIIVNGSSILNIGSSQWNRSTAGGTFLLKNTATLILSSNANGIGASNFPASFNTITLDSTSTVQFNGAAQTIPGITGSSPNNITGYGNLTLTNGNTKTLGNHIAAFRNLTVGANTTMALGNFNATLKSNNQTTAYVSAIPTTAAITYGTGRFDIERYLSAVKAWRFLATPIEIASSPTIAASWREANSAHTSTGFGTRITGPVGPFGALNILDDYTIKGSMKSYNAVSDAFVEVTNTNTTAIANKEGYFVFVRGDRGISTTGGPIATNLRIKGKLLIGDQTFTVPVNGFQSFGNPYASRIDFRTVTQNTIASAFTIWNPNSAGSYNVGAYETYVLESGDYKLNGSGAIKNFIESGQAAYIQSITGGSLVVKESDKIGGSSLVSRGDIIETSLKIKMFTKNQQGESYFADGVVLNFDNNYSNNIDNDDVKKVANTYDNLAIKKAASFLVAERMPSLTIADTIKLNTSGLRIATYSFVINPTLLESTTLEAFLKDNFLQTETPVSLLNESSINFETTSDIASRALGRFIIIFKQAAPTTYFTNISANRLANKTVALSWVAQNEINIASYSIEQSNDGINFNTLLSQLPTANNGGNIYYTKTDEGANSNINWYRIKANNTNGTSKYSNIAMVNALINASNNNEIKINILPNIIQNKTLNIQFNNAVIGSYNINLVNSIGQIVFSKKVLLQNSNTVQAINVGVISEGIYQAVITNKEGENTVIQIVVK